MRDYTVELGRATELINELLTHVRSVDQNKFTFVPPIIQLETEKTWRGGEVQGLHKFIDTIEKQAEAIGKVAASEDAPKEDPLPIVLGLVTLWKTLALARGPIPAVRMSVKTPGLRDGFVDVVAQGGAEWIRNYTKKTNHLLAEFREADSYINSDFDSDFDSCDEEGPGPSAAERQGGLMNNVIREADNLLAHASAAERFPGFDPPELTMRFTRIQENPPGGHPDPRFLATFEALRARGVNLVFGDFSEVPISTLDTAEAPRHRLVPSKRINLDPTALTALCSDLLHYPLPADEEEARNRFFRPVDVVGDADPQVQSQNSRELVRALIEELEHPLIEVVRDLLTEEGRSGNGNGPVEFWATREAVRYVQETIACDEVVGDGVEQQRMRRLTGIEQGNFWQGSRYEGREGVLANLRVNVFDEDEGEGEVPRPRTPLCVDGRTSFHVSLATVCRQYLVDYNTMINGGEAPYLPEFLKPQRMPNPRIARLSVPFKIVSLLSMARGAEEGMTTLAMGPIVFRELFAEPRWRLRGWSQSNYRLEDADRARVASASNEGDPASAPIQQPMHAAMWLLPYRSLGEAKRVKFAKGDYSFPLGGLVK